jgi:hypothetical protein
VLDFATPDFKQSAREYLDRADAVVLHEPTAPALAISPSWTDVSLRSIARATIFRACPPDYVTPELVVFVRERIKQEIVKS